jgi:hypothetical protein
MLSAASSGMRQLPVTNCALVKMVRLPLPNHPTPDSRSTLRQALKSGEKRDVQVDG